jgi:hypothetical protein
MADCPSNGHHPAQEKLPESLGPRGAKDSSLFRERLIGCGKAAAAKQILLSVLHEKSKRPAASMQPYAFAGPQTARVVQRRPMQTHPSMDQ